ncbi:hypothetical protein GCM10009613_10040 [Pseudonocardia kongjuensis]|uniref:AB hydrolase-1 domain-containing protein n=1 Tax=Pseudonocardia kongjuensis TaxID=102227 RepID=A0ABN1XLA3_9PSEU
MTSTSNTAISGLADVGDGVRIHYEERGTGDTVLLVHAGLYGDWFAPLLREPALDGHRIVRTHRSGYGASPRVDRHLTIADHARHCAAVLDRLGAGRSWIVGHSSGGAIALQTALDRPDLVAGLILLEPAPSPSGPAGAELGERVVGPAMAALGAGGAGAAARIFLDGVCGAHWAPLPVQRNGDGADAQLLADATYFFDDEIRAAIEWHLDPGAAAGLDRPVLIVHGARSPERTGAYAETAALLQGMLPDARCVELAGLGHAMPLEDPAAVAELVRTTVRGGAGAH